MKVEYINPFIESVNDLFSSMLNAEAKRVGLSVASNGGERHEITALIGLSGSSARGAVALSFPSATAIALAASMFGVESDKVDEMVLDAIAETANIVAGGAKAKLHNTHGDGEPIDLGLPTIVQGKDYTLHPPDSKWLAVDFSSDFGVFKMLVMLEITGG